jgi:hypothetical protein
MAPIIKAPIRRDRIRYIKGGFGWVDHRLVRDRYLDRCPPTALALYLFLVAVADADGVSYWGDAAICERMAIGKAELKHARATLIEADMLAYEKPIYQILSLPKHPHPMVQS